MQTSEISINFAHDGTKNPYVTVYDVGDRHMKKHIILQTYLFRVFTIKGKEQKGFDLLKKEIIDKAKESIKNIEETISMIENLSIHDTLLKVSEKVDKK